MVIAEGLLVPEREPLQVLKAYAVPGFAVSVTILFEGK
jgi:hypothetical protein